MNQRKAIITGVLGQDGSYLAEILLKNNYQVLGIDIKSDSYIKYPFLQSPQFKFQRLDTTNQKEIHQLICDYQPDEIFHLAAQTHVGHSFVVPIETFQSIYFSTFYILEAIKSLRHTKNIRFLHPSSSEMFGNQAQQVLNIHSAFQPCSPYAIAKVSAHHLVKMYRENDGLFATNAVMFNHESPRRGRDFVTQKIIQGLLNYQTKKIPFQLGNINTSRDWGCAQEYTLALWQLLQLNEPTDTVIATGNSQSVTKFIDTAAKLMNIQINWDFIESQDQALDRENGNLIFQINSSLFRPKDIDYLCGSPDQIKKTLNWSPQKNLEQIIVEMIDANQIEHFNNKHSAVNMCRNNEIGL